MVAKPANKHSYSIQGLDRFINRAITFIFYYRLVVVLLSLVILVFIVLYAWNASSVMERIRNAAAVITGGCVIIGIFYSLLNYENTLLKARNDAQTSKEVLTYNAAARMHEIAMIENSRTVRNFHTENKQLFIQGKFDEVEGKMLIKAENRTSYLALFNYFELISLGVQKGILDEDFMREIFKSVFKNFYGFFGTYIAHTRREQSSPKIYIHFTTLAERWINEN